MLRTPSRGFPVLGKSPRLYYPFGNTRGRNVLKDYNFHESDDNTGITKILFLGCGDLRKTFHAITTKHPQHIHLNDALPSILARNIMVLKIVSANDFNPDDTDDFSFIWDVWYNSDWSEITQKRFLSVLNDLLNEKLPENVHIPDSNHLQKLKKVWSSWHATASQNQLESELLMKKIHIERIHFIVKGMDSMSEGELREKSKNPVHFVSSVIDWLADHVEKHFGVGNEASTERVVRGEALSYFQTGNCRINQESGVCINPTLLDPTSLEWKVHYLSSPFDSYLPLTKEEQQEQQDTSVKSNMMTQSCQKILKRLLLSYRSRIENVEVFFHLEDALEFCYAGSAEHFDVIDCSNLADHVGLANIIVACSRILANHPAALLFTESIVWTYLADTTEKYVERALCCPLSMIPTIYGFRLTNRVELGASTIDNMRRNLVRPLDFCWRNAPRFRNISLSPSPTLNRFLDKLADVCFDTAFPREMFGSQPGDKCGSICYTPFTYNYVVNSMIQRVGGDRWYKDHRQLGIYHAFDLTKRTAEAWKDGEMIMKITAETQETEEQIEYLIEDLSEVPALRLVLVPCSMFEKSMKMIKANQKSDLSAPNIHFIDNFQFEIKRTPDGNSTIIVSFLLLPNHGLEKTHLAFLMDLTAGMTTFTFKPLQTMRIEKFVLPHPILTEKSSLSTSEDGGPQMVVDSCVESEDQYILQISIHHCDDEKISDLKVSTDQRKPCESAHEITLSLSQPNYIKPLLLSFPYPFLVDSIRASLHYAHHSISLVLNKAIQEPWPCEFENHLKWKADDLQPWKEMKKKLSDHLTHLIHQFNFYHLKNPSLMEDTALNAFRFNIATLYSSSNDFFCIQLKGSSKLNPDWYLRLHKPILTSPLNSPIVLLSAFHNQLTGKHTSKEKSDRNKAGKAFFGIFPDYKPEETLVETLEIADKECLQLWRFILRFNSTKIESSSWQKKHLPMGEDSPYLSTFISPLYHDFVMLKKPVSERIPSIIRPSNDSNSCAACKQTTPNLKRCSRCRSTSYCSVECQRQHWKQHKVFCTKK